jgi:hypothetical protein
MTRSGSSGVEVEVEELANAILIVHQIRLKTGTMEMITPRAARPPDRTG